MLVQRSEIRFERAWFSCACHTLIFFEERGRAGCVKLTGQTALDFSLPDARMPVIGRIDRQDAVIRGKALGIVNHLVERNAFGHVLEQDAKPAFTFQKRLLSLPLLGYVAGSGKTIFACSFT